MRSIKKNRKRKLSFIEDKSKSTNQSIDSRLDERLLVHLNQVSLINCEGDFLSDELNNHHITKLRCEPKLLYVEKSTAPKCTKNALFLFHDLNLPLDSQLPLNPELPRRKRRNGVSR